MTIGLRDNDAQSVRSYCIKLRRRTASKQAVSYSSCCRDEINHREIGLRTSISTSEHGASSSVNPDWRAIVQLHFLFPEILASGTEISSINTRAAILRPWALPWPSLNPVGGGTSCRRQRPNRAVKARHRRKPDVRGGAWSAPIRSFGHIRNTHECFFVFESSLPRSKK